METPIPDEPAHTYRATVISVYDGDTLTVDIDLGLGIWVRGQKIRVYGIDTPELRGEERPQGIVARDTVRGLIADFGPKVIIRTHKDRKGKYGRWIAEIFIQPETDDPINLGEFLVANGRAHRASY